MPNIAALLKSEIVRLARKEIRQELESLKKALSGYRSDIAALKKQVRALEAAQKRNGKPKTVADETPEEGSKLRFRPAAMKAHRLNLELSAKNYGRLVGASELSIYNWESGKATPRQSALVRIAAVRGMGKRQALRLLGEAGAP